MRGVSLILDLNWLRSHLELASLCAVCVIAASSAPTIWLRHSSRRCQCAGDAARRATRNRSQMISQILPLASHATRPNRRFVAGRQGEPKAMLGAAQGERASQPHINHADRARNSKSIWHNVSLIAAPEVECVGAQGRVMDRGSCAPIVVVRSPGCGAHCRPVICCDARSSRVAAQSGICELRRLNGLSACCGARGGRTSTRLEPIESPASFAASAIDARVAQRAAQLSCVSVLRSASDKNCIAVCVLCSRRESGRTWIARRSSQLARPDAASRAAAHLCPLRRRSSLAL